MIKLVLKLVMAIVIITTVVTALDMAPTIIIGWSIIIGSMIAIQSMISASKAKKKEQEEIAAIQAEREKDEFYYQRKMDRLFYLKWKQDMKRKYGNEFRFYDEV